MIPIISDKNPQFLILTSAHEKFTPLFKEIVIFESALSRDSQVI